jgi:metal-responsive CopG/Arc/MetJ family transcriptional regulator
MIRTQVYIPDDLHRELTLLAQTSGQNFSSLLREGVREVIKKKKLKKRDDWGVGFIGAIKGGPSDLSSKIDYYLYGEGNPKWAEE